MNTILVVEDDAPLRSALRAGLRVNDLEVVEAASGEEALELLRRRTPDIVLLDLTLPGIDGLEVLRQLRTESQIPVVVLTVRDDFDVKISALDAGADDYVTKPFVTEELLARVRAALRRAPEAQAEPDVISADGLVVDCVSRRVTRNDELVQLTPTEWRMLEVLVRQPGRLVTHARLAAELRGSGADSAVVRVHVTHLRRKLGDEGARPRFIVNEPGLGYRWLPEPAKR